MRGYTVSKDSKSGLWYAHMKGYTYIPVSGSFSEKKSEAVEYAKMYDGLPHKVEEIEQRRKEKFQKEMELTEAEEIQIRALLAMQGGIAWGRNYIKYSTEP